MRQTALLNGQIHFLGQYNYVKGYLGILRDSFLVTKNYAKAVEIQNEITKSSEILRGGIPKGDSIAITDYNDMAWYQIFAKQYAAAEQSCKHAAELDATQIVIKTNWGHALLFQYKDDEAKKVYDDLKIQKDGRGKSYRDILKEDFDTLEKAGLDKTQLDKARKWVAE